MNFKLKKSILLIFSCLLSLFEGTASARIALTGLADLEYSNFEENNSIKKINADQFNQRYEVGFSNGGVILDRGFGDYALSLRYQNLQYATSYDDTTVRADNSKFFWSGNINIIPKKLPISLRIYSNDLNPLTPEITNIVGVQSTLAPTAVSRLSSGSTIISGLFFELDNTSPTRGNGGNGNGRGNGRGNGNGGNGNGNGGNGNGNGRNGFSWRQLPKITLDYQNVYTDNGSIHDSIDDLKLSVNEKKNWLNYTLRRYANFNGSGNFTEEGYQIGNVTRTGGREWFYLNNWTLISADGKYNRRETDGVTGSLNSYSVNLFLNSFRSRWDSILYSSYAQTIDDVAHTSDSQLSIPLYITARPTAEDLINSKTSFRMWEQADLDNPATGASGRIKESKKEVVEDISSTHIHLTTQDITFKPRYTFSNEWGTSESLSSKIAHTLNLSLDSSPTKSSGYSLNYTFSTLNDSGPTVADDFTSHSLSINGRYAVTQWIGVVGSQSVTISEDMHRTPSHEARSYNTSVGANIYLHRTLNADVMVSRSYTENVGDGNDETRVYGGNIRYTPMYWLKVTSSNTYLDEKGEGSFGGSAVSGYTFSTVRDRSNYTSANLMDIKVNRTFSSKTRLDYVIEDDRLIDRKINSLHVEEGFEYTVVTTGYRARTLFSVTGSINYNEVTSNTAVGARNEGVTLGFNHYPYRYLTWGGTGRYSADMINDSVSKGGSVYIAFPFPKMTFNATYFFEDRDAAGNTADYNAHKLLVKLTKIF